jgi:hypothetical protein
MADQTAQSGGSNGFFSDLLSSGQTALQNITENVLPVWAAQQLGTQSKPPLNQDTRGPQTQPTLTTTQQTAAIVKTSPIPALLLIGGGIALVLVIIKLKR